MKMVFIIYSGFFHTFWMGFLPDLKRQVTKLWRTSPVRRWRTWARWAAPQRTVAFDDPRRDVSFVPSRRSWTGQWEDGWMDGWMLMGFGSCKRMMKDYESYFLIDDLFRIDLLRSLFKHQIKCIFARLRPFEKTSDRERSEVCNNWKRGHLDNQLSDNSQVLGFQNNHALRNWLAYACPQPVPSHILLKHTSFHPRKFLTCCIPSVLNSLF